MAGPRRALPPDDSIPPSDPERSNPQQRDPRYDEPWQRSAPDPGQDDDQYPARDPLDLQQSPDRRRSNVPPRPVLPGRPSQANQLPGSQTSAGRRFSGNQLPSDFVSSAARRSASSPSMWDDLEEEERGALSGFADRRHAPASYASAPRSQASASRFDGPRQRPTFPAGQAADPRSQLSAPRSQLSAPRASYQAPRSATSPGTMQLPRSQNSAARFPSSGPRMQGTATGPRSAASAGYPMSQRSAGAGPRADAGYLGYGTRSQPSATTTPAPRSLTRGPRSQAPEPVLRESANRSPEPSEKPSKVETAQPAPSRSGLRNPKNPRKLSWWVWAIIATLLLALLAVVVILAPGMWRTTPQGTSPSGNPDQLVTLDEIKEAGGTKWKIENTEKGLTTSSPLPKCLGGQAPRTLPNSSTATQRLLTSKSENLAALNRIDTYPDSTTAHAAFTARQMQLGGCDSTVPLYVQGAFALPGLGDEAVLVRITSQETPEEFHSVVVTRVGSSLIILDLSRVGDEPDRTAVLAVMRKIVQRDCSEFKGACNIGVIPAPIPAPAGTTPGFLGAADVPRVTPGIGVWTVNQALGQITTSGTMCEGVELKNPPGVSKMFQRTLVLQQDPGATSSFGIDEVVMVLPDADSAGKMAGTLIGNISSCQERMSTATVSRQSTFQANGNAGEQFKGTVFTIQQQAQNETIPFRVAVMNVGTRVVYVVLTPAPQYNLTEEQWLLVAKRAGERATQLS